MTRYAILLFALACLGCDDKAIERSPTSPLRGSASQSSSNTHPNPAPPKTPTPATGTPSPVAPRYDAWLETRVGDRVEYDLEGTTRPRKKTEPGVPFHLSLSAKVASVESARVWLEVRLRGLDSLGFTKSFLVPVAKKPSGSFQARAAPFLTEQAVGEALKAVSVGERTVACAESVRDARATDGPLTTRCVSTDPRLYLMNGLVSQAVDGRAGTSQLQLVSMERGKTGEAADKLADLPQLFAPDAWWRMQADESFALRRVRSEVGIVGVEETAYQQTLKAAPKEPRDDLSFTDGKWFERGENRIVSAYRLEDLFTEVARRSLEKPVGEADTLKLASGTAHVLSVKTESDTHREKFSRAADLWEAPLLPIPWPARLEDLVDFAEEKADGAWLPASGSSKLLDWGAGEWRPPPPPPPEEKHPEGLDKNVVKDTILAARDSMTCVKALRSRDKARHLTRKYRFQLKVTIRPDGTVTSATAKSRDASRAVSDCIAKAVRALRFPEHQKQQPAFDIEFPF